MNKIILKNLELKTFIEQNAFDYCQINNINPDEITELYLYDNRLTDISGIRLFKNLEKLFLDYNQLTDISVLKYLTKLKMLDIKSNKIKDISVILNLKNLEYLNIRDLRLKSDQIQYIKSLKNLKELYCSKGFKDINILNKLNRNIKIYE